MLGPGGAPQRKIGPGAQREAAAQPVRDARPGLAAAQRPARRQRRPARIVPDQQPGRDDPPAGRPGAPRRNRTLVPPGRRPRRGRLRRRRGGFENPGGDDEGRREGRGAPGQEPGFGCVPRGKGRCGGGARGRGGGSGRGRLDDSGRGGSGRRDLRGPPARHQDRGAGAYPQADGQDQEAERAALHSAGSSLGKLWAVLSQATRPAQ
jgi:hypothetical protein